MRGLQTPKLLSLALVLGRGLPARRTRRDLA